MSDMPYTVKTAAAPDRADRQMYADKVSAYNVERVANGLEPLPTGTNAELRASYEIWCGEQIMPTAHAGWVAESEINSPSRKELIETWEANAGNDAKRAAMIASGR